MEQLRQPLQDARVTLSRAVVSMTYLSRFMLVAAMKPCPCGYHRDSQRRCACAPQAVQRYLSRVSGPPAGPAAQGLSRARRRAKSS